MNLNTSGRANTESVLKPVETEKVDMSHIVFRNGHFSSAMS